MIRVFIFILFSFNLLEAQDKVKIFSPKPKYETLFKSIPTISDNDPLWVKLLYSESPNYFEIHDEYKKYYIDKVFKKNIHTQNFKYFSMLVSTRNYLMEDGSINIPIKKSNPFSVLSNNNTSRFSNHIGNNDKWTPIGPFKVLKSGNPDSNGDYIASRQVNIYTIEQSKSNPSVIYAGGETGGLYKSVDKALTWKSVGDDSHSSSNIATITIHPTNENIVYFSNNLGEIFKTEDGGNTWNVIYFLHDNRIEGIVISENDDNLILIAGSKGLYRTIDGGNIWNTILDDRCWDIKRKINDPKTVFVTKSNPIKKITEIYKSIDGGKTFQKKDTGWFSPISGTAKNDGGARIGLTDADPNRVYVLLLGNEVDYDIDYGYIGVYRSDDAGETWYTPYDGNNDGLPDNNPGGPYSSSHQCLACGSFNTGWYNQGFYDSDIEVSDTDPDHFLLGGIRLARSFDGGITYTDMMAQNNGIGYRHVDIQEIEINGNDAWVASDGGIDYYNAVTLDIIESRNKGIDGSHFWGFDQGWNYDIMVGGKYHNGNSVLTEDFGEGNAIDVGGNESATGYVNKGENKKVYFSDSGAREIIGTNYQSNVSPWPSLYKSISNYALFPNESYAFYGYSEVVTDPRSWNTLYLGKDHKLWKSENGGSSFYLLKEFGNESDHIVQAIEISRTNPDLIFITQRNGKLWKTEDGGDNWTEIYLPFSQDNTLFISLNSDNELYLANPRSGNSTEKIFKSSDLGNSWENLTTSKLNGHKIKHLHVQEGTDGGVYIASFKYMWYKNNTHSEWQNFSHGLPVGSEGIMRFQPFYRDGKIRIAGGRGIWERDLYEESKPKAQPFVSRRKLNECTGIGIVQFEDFSILNHHNATWQWDFPGAATVSSSTVRNPEVTYSSTGSYDVTLTVTNDNGTDTKTISDMIVVEDNNLCDPEPNPQMAFEANEDNDYLVNETVNEKLVSEFTFTAWVKPNGIQPDYSAIFSLSSGDGNEKNVLNFRESNNTLGFHWNGTAWNWDSNLIVPANEWSFVAITVTSSKVNLYVNESSFSFDFNSIPFDLNRIILGSYYTWSSRNYKGLIEEATFWKRALSNEEIRLSRHLTKSNLDDDLIAYYQFNHNEGGIIYDKKNVNYLNVNGGELVISDAPVGPGESSLISVDGGGVKDFSETDLSIKFPNNGSYPDGDVVVSKIDINPSKIPNKDSINSKYWFINNYGNNVNFSYVESIEFSNLNGVENLSASGIEMFLRDRNSGKSDNWISQTKANSTNPSEKSVTFNSTGINAFDYQIYIGTDGAIVGIEDLEQGIPIILYPNPMVDKTLYIKGLNGESRINLYDASGKHVLNEKLLKSSVNLSNLSPGIYIYILESKYQIVTGKLVIK